jgi:serine/threonine protein kinase
MKIGTILVDRYQICEQLNFYVNSGRGTFLAQDLQTQRLVIIKTLEFNEYLHEDDLELFMAEVSTLKKLTHPAIPKYLDYLELTRTLALVQSYIEASSLESLVGSDRQFSEIEAIELADQLLSILIYLHEQNPSVIHLAINPSNVLLTNRSDNSNNSLGDVYLLGFGWVRTAAMRTAWSCTIVDPGYRPPEQFFAKVTVTADLYSLGMTIAYALTGDSPIHSMGVSGEVEITAEFSSEFRSWLKKITQRHLGKRFESAQSARVSLRSANSSCGR